MRADREDLHFADERRTSPFGIGAVIGVAVLGLAVLAWFAFRAPAEPAPQAQTMPVVRDSAVVAPPVVDTTAAAPTAAPAAAEPAGNFTERRLAPSNPTVSAGAAPTVEYQRDERGFIIDGPLLEELEEDARQEAEAAQ